MGKLLVSARYGIIAKAEFLDNNLNEGENRSMDIKKINTELKLRKLEQFMMKEAQYAIT